MEIPIIKIGNSKGLRLSQTVLKKYKIEDKVEVILEEEALIIKPVKKTREGWGSAFKEMQEANDDELLIDDFFDDEQMEV